MYCAICGDEKDLSQPLRFWSADDGRRIARLCRWCRQDLRQPRETDYAWDRRGDYVTDDQEAIDTIYG